mgnify:CR=1 FL=1
MVTRSLLLVSDDRKILIDTGNGTKWDKKYKDIYNIKQKINSIQEKLKSSKMCAICYDDLDNTTISCLLYTSPSPRD